MLSVLFLAAFDTRPPAIVPKQLAADDLFRAALMAHPHQEMPDCAMPEAIKALDGDLANRDFLSTLAIQGPTHTYATPHFRLIYAADPESRHAVPSEDTNETLTLPDGTTRALTADGVPNYIERAGHFFEYSRVAYIAEGFRVPSGVVEVRFVFIVDRFGGISLEPFGIGISARLDNARLAHVAAHELFHQIQYQHADPTWLTYFGKLDNPSLYDTFALEAVANAGSSLIFASYGSNPLDGNTWRYAQDPDVDFWNQGYDGATFWRYTMETLSHGQRGTWGYGSDVLIAFMNERGHENTKDSLRRVLTAFNGPSLTALVAQYRVAFAMNVSVATRELTTQIQSEIDHDGGAEYFTLPTARSGSHVLRVVGASADLRAQIAQVYQQNGQRGVALTPIAGRDGKNDVTFTAAAGLVRSYVIVESLDGAQPFIVALDPVASEVPDLDLKCSSGSSEAAWIVLAAIVLTRRRRVG